MRNGPKAPEQDLAARIRLLLVDVLTSQVIAGFEGAGVPVLLLKGPGVADRLYRQDELRLYVDVDLLVPASKVAQASAVLESEGFRDVKHGFRADERIDDHALTYRRLDASGQSFIDLHYTLPGLFALGDRVFQSLQDDAEDLVVGGRRVRVPGPVGMLLALALQAAHDGPGKTKACQDLSRAVVQGTGADWRSAWAQAESLGAVALVREGLSLIPEGVELLHHLRLEGAYRELVLPGPVDSGVARALRRLLRQPKRSWARSLAQELWPSTALLNKWQEDHDVRGNPWLLRWRRAHHLFLESARFLRALVRGARGS